MNNYHIAVFELYTEEESVLTLLKLFKEAGCKVSLLISSRIWNLICGFVQREDLARLILFQDTEDFTSASKVLDKFVSENKVDLFIFTRFTPKNFSEINHYRRFLKKVNSCCLIENYTRWFSPLPPLKYSKRFLISPGQMFDWYCCRKVFPLFSSYFISEIHTDSDNPLKKEIQKRNKKPVFDFPFKIMEDHYSPSLDYPFPVFVIPGKIEDKRRNYFSVLDFFRKPEYKKYPWKLILLGRPIDRYGKKVIATARKINSGLGENRIDFIDRYIGKAEFEKYFSSATHLLVPVTADGYSFGKDTGAMYDILKFNKIGIVNNHYFYRNDLVEKEALITYSTEKELHLILEEIILRKYNYNTLSQKLDIMNSNFSKQHYVSYIRKQMKILRSNSN